MGLKIIATGKSLPEKRLWNEDMCAFVDTSDEWIRTRTGIRSRYKCETETCTDLAVEAARKAVTEAVLNKGIRKEEIGAVLVATSTGENAFPSTACMVQRELGLSEEVLAFDLSSACTGFLHGLAVANGLFAGSEELQEKYILLIGSERMSGLLDYEDRSTCVLFGDGGAAVLLKYSEGAYYQKNWTRGDYDVLHCNRSAGEKLQMKGNDVFRFAVTVLEQGIREVLKHEKCTMDDVTYVVCHQANERILHHVAKKFPGNEQKFYCNIAAYGNTSAASIPIALHELCEAGEIPEKNKFVLVGFGAGLSWSAAMMEF